MTWRRTLIAAAMPAADPVASGLVAGLARPGGKVTGHSIQGLVLGLKRLEILAEVLGKPARLAYLDKIFRGAKVPDLPVGQASKFDLLLNLKMARAAVARRRGDRVTRRSLLRAAGATTLGAALAVPHALGQAAKEPRRVALLSVLTEATSLLQVQAFRDGLREHGHVEGRDIVIDIRYTDGRAHELPRLAAELAALKPSVIVAPGAPAADAVLASTVATPIVTTGDLIATRHAATLGRPGGRVTGISLLPWPLNAKRLELPAQVLPMGSTVLNLADPLARDGAIQVVEDAGRSLGLVTHAACARTPAEIEAAFVDARRLRVAGVNVLSSQPLQLERAHIIRLAASARLPAIYQWPETVRDGGLMAYGPSLAGMYRQLGGYASRILNGARPADLPVEQPTKFELVINLKTARALGIIIAPTLLLRADEVIQ